MAQDYSDQQGASNPDVQKLLGDGFATGHPNKPMWESMKDDSIKELKEKQQDAMKDTAVRLARELWETQGDDLLGDGLNASGELKKTCVVMFYIDRTHTGKDGLGHRIGYSGGVYSKTQDGKLEKMREQAKVKANKETICGEEQVLIKMDGDKRSTMLFSVAFDKKVGLKAACGSGCNKLGGFKSQVQRA